MIVPKVREGKVALDANGGKNNPYFRESDPTNINQLWRFRKTGENYMIVPKVGEGRLALIADEVKGRPYIGKPDAMAKNCLWELRKTGEYYLIVPVVTVPKLLDFHEEIENIVRKAREAGGDRKATLNAIEKTVKELRAKPGS